MHGVGFKGSGGVTASLGVGGGREGRRGEVHDLTLRCAQGLVSASGSVTTEVKDEINGCDI